MLRNILQSVKNENIKIILLKNKVNVMNYKEILVFDDNYILIDCSDFMLKIKGISLIIEKLEDQEVLITGKSIDSLEMK